MSSKKITTVKQIYSLADGGITEIAYRLGVCAKTVESWPQRGIPDTYWERLRQLYGVSPSACFRINGKIRGYTICG